MITAYKKMEITLRVVPIRDVIKGYKNSDEEGVVGLHGKLNIRPKYQREFIYSAEKQANVIRSINKGYPLGIMYWSKDTNNTFGVLDGQQRLLSICEYCEGNYPIDNKYFFNLTVEEQEQLLNYELKVYLCEGTEAEKLEWFEIINIAGEELTKQELRNAVYTGAWLTDAKRYFSKTGCASYNIGHDYLTGTPIRQDYLETVIRWISKSRNENDIRNYMALHQQDKDANELWAYFQKVISWVKVVYPNYRKEMKNVNWGSLYNDFSTKHFNSDDLEKEVTKLMQDEDVTKKQGIYIYLISREEKYLSVRAFNDRMKREAYTRQGEYCSHCERPFKLEEMDADHITPWSKGGKTVTENCQMLCKNCNRTKSGT